MRRSSAVHLLERRTAAGSPARLCCSLASAQVEQLLTLLLLMADVGPVLFDHGSKRPALLGQTGGIAIAPVIGEHFGKRGIGGCTRLFAAVSFAFQNRASEDPGKGEPALKPSTSTIVAATSADSPFPLQPASARRPPGE